MCLFDLSFIAGICVPLSYRTFAQFDLFLEGIPQVNLVIA